jgi:parallel beta-helix repeat protein
MLFFLLILFNLVNINFSYQFKVEYQNNCRFGEEIDITETFLSPIEFNNINSYNPNYPKSLHLQTNPPNIKVLDIKSITVYSESSPIFINNNTDFGDEANTSGWLGNGSFSSPYIIQNLNITTSSTSGNLIEIMNTNVSFLIEKCLLVGASEGIKLNNVSNGKMSENHIANYSSVGVDLKESSKINVSSNIINSENGLVGLLSQDTNNSLIINNTLNNHEREGVHFTRSHNSQVSKNWVFENGEEGIFLSESENISFKSNWIYNNTWDGVELSLSDHCFFENNSIIENGESDFYIYYSNDCTVFDNSFYSLTVRYSFFPKILKNNIFGKLDFRWGGSATIFDNLISSPGDWAIYLNRFSNNNISNNYISKSGGGIYLDIDCGNSTLANLYVIDCMDNSGYILDRSGNSSIFNITAINCHTGFRLANSENCTLTEFYLVNSTGSGCEISSSSFSNITNLTITNTSSNGFRMEETNLTHIENITILDSYSTGFEIVIVNNCTFYNIYVYNASYSGLYMSYSRFNHFKEMNISNTETGIRMHSINDSTLEQCIIYNSSMDGISIERSSGLFFLNCASKNNLQDGFKISDSDELNFSSCSSSNNQYSGFDFDFCSNSYVNDNHVFNNIDQGMDIRNSILIKIIESAVYDNANEGIRLYESEHCIVGQSIFFRNTYTGLTINIPWEEEYSGNNTITQNDFIANGFEQSESQIHYESTSDSVSYNFYDSHREPDDDSDGIIDIPYLIGENYEYEEQYFDNYPLSMPYNIPTIHYVTQPIMIYPSSYNISDPYYIEPVLVSGTITVEWLQSIDSYDEELTYSFWIRFQSLQTEENWTLAVDGITSNSYDWDTTSIYRGNYYFKVVASHISGINVSSREQQISINNAPPELTDFYSSPGFPIFPILCFIGVIVGYRRRYER